MGTGSYLTTQLSSFLPHIEEEMRRIINAVSTGDTSIAQPVVFNTMLNYHLGFAMDDGTPTHVYSGKRIRPVLALLCCEACGGQVDVAYPAAAAIELLHNFSLIHDDIEDGDDLRRGRQTLWKIWGEAQAINSGDAMFTLAHMALETAIERAVDAGRVLRSLRVFDEACLALTIGQHLDLSFENRNDVTAAEYKVMIQGKTGALTKAACAIGAILAGAPQSRVNLLAEFGESLGVAFQLQDDVLGIWGDPGTTGKQDSDLSHRKKTLPVLYAAERDAALREVYFVTRSRDNEERLDETMVQWLRSRIEDSGARAYTEEAALAACNQSLHALDAAQLTGDAAIGLRELAQSLLGRAS
ncbi:MAG TPA: polyprenyl synthetase family protein [Anaerolineae bacterium]|jgi:geranylgeranyl diphosphate synthase type I